MLKARDLVGSFDKPQYINFAPELTGIGKYSGEMAAWLASWESPIRSRRARQKRCVCFTERAFAS